MKIINFFVVLLVVLSAVPFVSADEVFVDVIPPTCVEPLEQAQVRCLPPRYSPRIDVVFVIDSTGSMADEIRTVKTHLIKIVKEVQSGQPTPYLRVGVVAYRDHESEEQEYLYRKFELTNNIDKAVDFIRRIEARGGGDLPEAVADGLDVAINQMNWNDIAVAQNQDVYKQYPYTKKLVFLIGDAAPHGEGSTDNSYRQGCPDGHNYRENIKDARDKGITIYTATGSGVDYIGTKIFREIAMETGGSYTHLRYARQAVEEYYDEEGFTPEEVIEYAAEAKEYADYDRSTNSILTNTLGKFAMGSMKIAAQEAGVRYDDADDRDDSWLDVDDITGDVVVDNKNKETSLNGLYGFLKNIFDRIAFWR